MDQPWWFARHRIVRNASKFCLPPSALVSTSVFSVVPLCRPLSLFRLLSLFRAGYIFFNVSSAMFLFDYVDCYYRVCIDELWASSSFLQESVALCLSKIWISFYIVVHSRLLPCFIPLFENLRIFFFQSDFDFWICLLPLVLVLISLSFAINQLFCFYSSWIYSKIDYDYFFQLLFRFSLSIMCVRIRESDTVYYIVSRWLRENCSIPIVDILYKVRNAKCSLVTLQIDGMWFNGEYRRKTGVSMRVSPFVFIPMKA